MNDNGMLPLCLPETQGRVVACRLQLLLIPVVHFPPGIFTQVALQSAVFFGRLTNCLHLIVVFLFFISYKSEWTLRTSPLLAYLLAGGNKAAPVGSPGIAERTWQQGQPCTHAIPQSAPPGPPPLWGTRHPRNSTR